MICPLHLLTHGSNLGSAEFLVLGQASWAQDQPLFTENEYNGYKRAHQQWLLTEV